MLKGQKLSDKLNSYLIKKMAKSKVYSLYTRKHLILLIYQLNEELDGVKAENVYLKQKTETFNKESSKVMEYCEDLKAENGLFQKENLNLKEQLKKAKTSLEAHTDEKYKLAYERLAQKYEELQSENKSIVKALETVEGVVKNIEKQNKEYKRQFKIVTADNNKLLTENQNLKNEQVQKQNSVVALKAVSNGEPGTNKIVTRRYTAAKSTNNSKALAR